MGAGSRGSSLAGRKTGAVLRDGKSFEIPERYRTTASTGPDTGTVLPKKSRETATA